MIRSFYRPVGAILAATMALAAAAPVAADEPPPGFYDSFTIAGSYHRQLSLLPARYPDQPERAAYEFERLTDEALDQQRSVAVHPCFAEWWAYELAGLELMSLSHELRSDGTAQDPEADAVERLGSRTWAKAMSLVPRTGEACGAAPRTDGPRVFLTLRPGEPAADTE